MRLRFPATTIPHYHAIARIDFGMGTKIIYLDNQSTTPVDPLVVEAMRPYFFEEYGNSHSSDHVLGWNADAAVNKSRKMVANLIGADAREIIFTSGATESCNLALRGVTAATEEIKDHQRRKIVTSAIEHPCVLETCNDLERRGWDVAVIGVNPDGTLDMNEFYREVDEQTLIVSIMTANNEIGVLQPVHEIGHYCQLKGAYLHTDATQAVGKIPIDVQSMNVDLLSFSGHKLYGPKGIGVLYVNWKSTIHIKPLLTGGGQERGLRPGTIPVALVVGLGEACRIAHTKIDEESFEIKKLTEKLRAQLFEICPDAILFGNWQKRLPGNISIGFPGLSGDEVVSSLGDHIAMSTGSACSSVKVEPSHVLLALGVSPEVAQSGLRMSVGRFNTEVEIDEVIQTLKDIINSN